MALRDVVKGTLEFLHDLPKAWSNYRYWSNDRAEYEQWAQDLHTRDRCATLRDSGTNVRRLRRPPDTAVA